jgi:hypothetical protein
MAVGYVYFIEAESVGLVKIGWTGQPPVVRFGLIRGMSPVPLTMLGVVPGGREAEADLHREFRLDRERGEWFRVTPRLRDFIRANAQPCPPERYFGPSPEEMAYWAKDMPSIGTLDSGPKPPRRRKSGRPPKESRKRKPVRLKFKAEKKPAPKTRGLLSEDVRLVFRGGPCDGLISMFGRPYLRRVFRDGLVQRPLRHGGSHLYRPAEAWSPAHRECRAVELHYQGTVPA